MSLADLKEFIASLDPGAALQGLSYSLTKNHQLGYSSDLFSPFPFVPYGTWDKYDKPGPGPIPSVLENAFLDTVVLGHQIDGRPNAKYSFIDILQLQQPDPIFFTEPLLEGPYRGKSLVEVLADVVNSMDPEITPVIRYLVGNPIPPPVGPSPTEYVKVFWPRSDGAPIFSHPKAMLYVGSFNPGIRLAQDLKQTVDIWIKALVKELDAGEWVSGILTNVAELLINGIVADDIAPMTWNHAKIVAVNGRALLTGGANYFDLYASGQDSLIDIDMTILGDVAVSAHNYADYLWEYLDRKHQLYDSASQAWSWPLASPAPQSGLPISHQPTPTFPSGTPRLSGNVPVLATGKVGNFNPTGDVQYPAQILTALRDVFYNLAWAATFSNTKPLSFWAFPSIVAGTSDSALAQTFAAVGVNPASWASRAARAWAISRAQDHVIITQQMLVNWVLVTQRPWQNLVAQINDLGVPWDGKIWPFDVILSLAHAITNIEIKHQNNPDDATNGVYIMVSEYAQPLDPAPQGYQDTTTIADLTACVAEVLRAVTAESPNGCFGPEEVPGVVARRFHVKRSVLLQQVTADGPAVVTKKKLHTKAVGVDGQLLYVGSDNAYPQWNEQFGVWIEDRAKIKAWEDEFFWGLWKRAVDSEE